MNGRIARNALNTCVRKHLGPVVQLAKRSYARVMSAPEYWVLVRDILAIYMPYIDIRDHMVECRSFVGFDRPQDVVKLSTLLALLAVDKPHPRPLIFDECQIVIIDGPDALIQWRLINGYEDPDAISVEMRQCNETLAILEAQLLAVEARIAGRDKQLDELRASIE